MNHPTAQQSASPVEQANLAAQNAQYVLQQTKAGLSEVIAHQAEQLLNKDKQIAQLNAYNSALQQRLQIAAAELDGVKKEVAELIAKLEAATEPKTDGSVSGAITEAQSLADLHGLPRPSKEITAAEFMAANNIVPPGLPEH